MTLGYLLGMVCGDASLYGHAHHKYRIELKVHDKSFAEEFRGVLKNHTHNKVSFRHIRRLKRNPSTKLMYLADVWLCRTNDKELYFKLKEMKDNVSGSLASMDDENKKLFLRALYQSDGCFTRSGRNPDRYQIILSKSDIELLNLVAKILSEFDIKITNIYQKSQSHLKETRTRWNLMICRQMEVAKFLDLVGSVGFGRGVTKIPIKFPLDARLEKQTTEG